MADQDLGWNWKLGGLTIGGTDLLGSTSMTGKEPTSISSRLFGAPASISSVANLSPEQKTILDSLLKQLGAGTTVPYGGQLTAAQNPLQGMSLAAMEQMAMNAASPEGATGTSTRALTDIINQTPQDLTSYFQKAIYDPTMQEFQTQILPAITQRFGGLAGFGSDRMAMEAKAAGEAATGVGAKVAEAVQAQEKNRLAAALGLPGVQTAGIQDLLSLQTGGAAARGQEQLGLSARYAEFQRQQEANQKNIEDILMALGIKTTTPVVTPGTSGLLGGLLGGGGGSAIGGAVAGLMSDRRLKMNIVRVGTHTLGIGIYIFQYIWGDWARGVMADEVETVMPEAVIHLPCGFDAVNYKMLAAAA